MRLFNDLSDADIDLGFVPQHDTFKKRDLAFRITGLFDQLDHGSVCLLDGRWGTGKSTFVKQWAADLKTRNIPSIYFDSFSADYMDSAFEAIAGTFIQAAIEAKRSSQPAYKNFLAKAATVGKTIASASAKVGVKVATLGAVGAGDLEGLGKIGDVLADGMSDITEDAIKKTLENHANKKQQFSELRESLNSLPDLLKPNQEDDNSPPLIVFIDELDRCRPDFSLSILEILKHLFRSNKIHFVLVTNRQHLELAVNHRYGVGAAAQEYLEKFYDFVVFFENSYEKREEGSISAFIATTVKNLIPQELEDFRYVSEYIQAISMAFQLSLRQIQNLTMNVSLAYMAAREREFRPVVLLSFLAIIKTIRPDLYRKAKSNSLSWLEVKEFLESVTWKGTDIGRVISLFRYHLDSELDVNSQEWRGYGESIWNYNIERERVIPYLANSILDRFAASTQDARTQQ